MADAETVLVTGGNGFLGMRLILQLLQEGYDVKATLLSIKSKDKVIEILKSNGIILFCKLSFVEAELTKGDNWAEAMQSCKYVLSVASPVFFNAPKDQNEAIRPAVNGILRILGFARASNI